MRNRFHLDVPLEPGSTVTLEGEEFHHAVRVHRTRVGEEVELFDGRGRSVVARLVRTEGRGAELEVLSVIQEPREPRVEVEIAFAIIQPEKIEFVLQKGTELGASSFQPLLSARTEVRPERVRGKEERWRKIVLEAAKQSGRSVIPRVEPLVRLEEALAHPGVNVMLDPSGTEGRPSGESVRLFVGPEGGWSEEELASGRAAGGEVWSLGLRRLRAETAAIAATALLTIR